MSYWYGEAIDSSAIWPCAIHTRAIALALVIPVPTPPIVLGASEKEYLFLCMSPKFSFDAFEAIEIA